jgi:hypothetical protein
MPARILPVHAPASVVGVELTRPRLARVRPVRQSAVTDPAEIGPKGSGAAKSTTSDSTSSSSGANVRWIALASGASGESVASRAHAVSPVVENVVSVRREPARRRGGPRTPARLLHPSLQRAREPSRPPPRSRSSRRFIPCSTSHTENTPAPHPTSSARPRPLRAATAEVRTWSGVSRYQDRRSGRPSATVKHARRACGDQALPRWRGRPNVPFVNAGLLARHSPMRTRQGGRNSTAFVKGGIAPRA